MIDVKPQPDRLYGRVKGHKLRPRQDWLLAEILPRLLYPTIPFASTGRELWLEVGFGGGEHAVSLAADNTDIGLIACEVFEPGICSLLSRLVPEGDDDAALPGNLRLWTDDARLLLRDFPDAALSRVFLMFPDPWPKARHAKRRFVHPATIIELARVLRAGGEWRIASDDPTYQAWVIEVFATQSLFALTAHGKVRPAGWPPTRYEAKAIKAGRQPLYWSAIKR